MLLRFELNPQMGQMDRQTDRRQGNVGPLWRVLHNNNHAAMHCDARMLQRPSMVSACQY